MKIESTKARKGTPPPKSRKAKLDTDPEEIAAITASVKGKGKARAENLDSAVLKISNAAPSTSLPTSFKVIAGSYEKLLYGLDGQVAIAGSEYKFTLKPIFIFPAHISHIKAVAASPGGGKWLATGSADEIIKVWDLRRRKEIGGLMHHEGTRGHIIICTEY